jgi:ferredoxin
MIADQRVNGLARFSVDGRMCLGCGLCHERAAENFDVPEGEFSSRVTRQPISAVEEDACIEAEKYCPAGGISHEPGDS